jgi:two-component system NtrC family sensor kinase
MTPAKNYLSLRTLFIRWLVLFSVLPLVLIVAFFAQKFKSAVQDEMFERLIVYTKQVQDTFNDYESFSRSSLSATVEDKSVLYQLKTASPEELRGVFEKMIEQEIPTAYAIYNQYGAQVLRVGSRDFANQGPNQLADRVREALDSGDDMYTHAYYYAIGDNTYLNLSVVKHIRDETLNWSGYLEKTILVDEEILKQLKADLGLDVIFFGPKGTVFLTSLPEEKFTQEQLSQDFLRGNNHFFDVTVKGQNFGFISTAVDWGGQKFLIAIGASKNSLTRSLTQLMYMLLVALFILIVCLLVFSYFFTNQIIQPISRLVEGIRRMHEQEEPVSIESKSRTEIGMLTDSFNEMSQAIYGYRYDLENKVQDLEKANTEIQSTQGQLLQSAKLASLGQLVAGVAHELNNPIGFVYSNMQHLREYTGALTAMVEELGKKNPAFDKLKEKYDYNFISKDLPKLIASCEEGAKRTRDIVTGLRNFSRSSDKDQKKFSVTDCIDSTLDLLKGAAKKERITVEKQYAEYIPLIQGNPNQISQVFMNVLSNAYQAIEGEGQIRIAADYLKEEGQIRIRVADSGKGIEPENLTKIFDPFFTTKDVGQGTGLGLSISYGIMKGHGGDISVESEVGRGTTFIITLPVSE